MRKLLKDNERQELWHYPEDRKPNDEEYQKDLKTDEEFLKIGPRFATNYWAHQQKKVNGTVDPSVIRSRLLQVFCQRNINDKALKHFDRIANEVFMSHR